jgi:diguanylate cyclase (GGDEF)-like protein
MPDSENPHLHPDEQPAPGPEPVEMSTGTEREETPAEQPAAEADAEHLAPEADVEEPAPEAGAPAATATDGQTAKRSLPRPSGRTLAWGAAAVLCVAAGAAASLIGAHAVARSDASEQRSSFKTASAGTASTLRLAIAHEEELATGAGTFFAAHPNASPQQFAAWTRWAHVVRRHPELQRVTLVGIVRAAELSAFADRLAGRTPAPAGAGTTSTTRAASGASSTAGATAAGGTGTFGTTAAASAAAAARAARPAAPPFPLKPSGTRAFYCLAFAELTARPSHQRPHGLDYCATRHELLAARGSGQTSFATSSVDGSPALSVTVPVYAGNPAPGSAAARSAAFVGWVRELMLPNVMIAQALRGRPALAVRLRHGAAASGAIFTGGSTAPAGQSTAGVLRSGWSARISGPAVQTGVFANRDSKWLLLGGCLLSVLLGALVFLMGTRRAGMLVPRRPGRPAEDLYDPLTGLPTRVLTMDRAGRMVARTARQSGLLTGALVIDLDWFGDVNEKLGREAGDQLLCIVGERLEKVVREGDSVGRLEGDEFVIVVEAAARGARLDALARRVIESLHKPVDLPGFGPNVFLTASIGIAFGRYTSPEELIHDARLALQSAKSAGKDRYTLFNANMRAVIEDRGLLEAELNTALQERHFFLFYQPIYDLANHRVVAVEALIRWRHPKRGVLLPDDFIPLAEETGLIVPIGRWVLEEACARAAAWNVSGHRIGVSVMITANQLHREGLTVDVLRALQQSGLDPALLTLEIAESTVMADVAATAERLEQLKRLGVSIAVDDFGSGYAYRSDLQRMPLDLLKVDRRSLAASEDEDYRNWLLEAILVFARDLSLSVVAKGVETAEQLANLRAMGCAMAQGYFIGEPGPVDSVVAMVEQHLPVASAGPAPAAASQPAAAAAGQPASTAAAGQPGAAVDAGQPAPVAGAGRPGPAAGARRPG